MDKQSIRIKLRAYDNKVLDRSTEEIVNTVKRTGANIKGKFDSPDEATKAAFVQAKKAETDVEISLDTTKGHYLDIGNVVFVFVQDYPEITGKHRIVSKSVNCSKAAVTCKLQLAKERPQLSEYFSN